MTSETGLSPLARGTYRDDRMTEFVTRFIPAGAGNIPVPDGGSVLDPVYPRWRGEHISILKKYRYCCGLSPLARGTY